LKFDEIDGLAKICDLFWKSRIWCTNTGDLVFIATLLFCWDSDFEHFSAFSRVFPRFIRNFKKELSTALESATKCLEKTYCKKKKKK
jgi:hypothetical protein